MNAGEHYASPGAVEAAIAAAARTASRVDPSLTVQERIRQEYFHRFLSRIFSESANADWVLKGGTAMLARVASARATTDVDLLRRSATLTDAINDLRRLAAIDLGDFFRFELTGYTDAVDGNQQAYVEGYQVNFDVYIGSKKKGGLRVDLVVNAVVTDDIDTAPPANAINLPKLRSYPYRLYPVVDQIADKVCATLALYNGRPSSREKDLVDLVMLAATHDVNANKLERALTVEAQARSLALPRSFELPSAWGSRYSMVASSVPACQPYREIESAQALMRLFIDPIFDGNAKGKDWSFARLTWR